MYVKYKLSALMYNKRMEELKFGPDCWISGDPNVPDPPEQEAPKELVEIRVGRLVLKNPNCPEMGFMLSEENEN